MPDQPNNTLYFSIDMDPETGDLRKRALNLRSVPLLQECEWHTHDGTPHNPRWVPGDIAVVAQTNVSHVTLARTLRQLADALSLDQKG